MTQDLIDRLDQPMEHLQTLDPQQLSDGPDICRETRLAIVDLIRGQEPRTVLSLLLVQGRAMEVASIAGFLGRQVRDIDETVRMLEREDLVARVVENGRDKIKAFAAYTRANS